MLFILIVFVAVFVSAALLAFEGFVLTLLVSFISRVINSKKY